MGAVEGKIAIVTGAAMGLGAADARLLAAEGATVILTDINDEAGQAVSGDIGGRAKYVHLDVRDDAAWKQLIDDTVAAHGGLDILVNNAGVLEPGTIETQTPEEYKFVMDVSAGGAFYGCRHGYAAMRDSGGGSIINMCSIASVQGASSVVAYAAAKGAVESLSRAIAAFSAQRGHNIRCNTVHPSDMDTPMVAAMPDKLVEAGLITREKLDSLPVGKRGAPQDVANAVLFLASDASRYINGTQIRVDFGASIIPGFVPDKT